MNSLILIRPVKSTSSASPRTATRNSNGSCSFATIFLGQILDGNSLQRLCVTLERTHLHPSGSPDVLAHTPANGAIVPQGYHLVYFTPCAYENQLGPDGSDAAAFNPPPPFTRRLWVKGSINWFQPVLRVGDDVEEITKITRAVAKKGRTGAGVVLVEVERSLYKSPGGLCLIDRRSWVFSRPYKFPYSPAAVLPESSAPEYKTEIVDMPDGTRQFVFSPVALFRFSALTFNAHMIHYNESWATVKEGHIGTVVHQQLSIINIMDLWRDSLHRGDRGPKFANLKQLNYRAWLPIYAGERFTIQILPNDTTKGKDLPAERRLDLNTE
ncbi:hypothetical protein QBC44DRAFT_393508 [Cladorrhinum sp. PSN332]|nr:hypothetical protein QBC44DRAFT_393508 [Cladorrhinum sp. PSN332]